MKKSSVLLTIFGVIISAWFIIFEVLCASAVIDIANGQPSKYGFPVTDRDHSPGPGSSPAIRLESFRHLEILGRNKVSVLLHKGIGYSMMLDSKQVKTTRWWYDNDRLVVEVTGLRSRNSLEVLITVPGLESVSGYHLSDLTLEGFDQPALNLSAYDVFSLILKDNRIGSLLLNNQDAGHDKVVTINKNNRFDSLDLIIRGSGTLHLQTAGHQFNRSTLSDSLEIYSDIDILRKLGLK
jgi:hypothetical protein